MKLRKLSVALAACAVMLASGLSLSAREKYNFNSDWKLKVGDIKGADQRNFNDGGWKSVTLPHAFNEDEAFKVPIAQLTDTIAWYRKHFKLPKEAKGKKVFAEFEGVRMGADFYLNGHHLGFHENGVMAVGLDLTPYINYGGDNVLAVRTDNSWTYRERATNQRYQWNDKNFNANYGGIPKNVWLHVADKVYQTLPLYSNLGTTGVYIYATDIEVESRRAVINAESEVRNESKRPVSVGYKVEVIDPDGKTVGSFSSNPVTIAPGATTTVAASDTISDLHFWSWGYGYLYDVKTILTVDGKDADEVVTRTGFRKTRFGDGKIWLNDRVIQMKGYAQRTSNEWPGVGLSVPPWMSDYSNGMLIDHNANFFRWMHVTAWKQDAESCDRVGVMQMLPAGDAEKDVNDRRWGQRTELMRDMIIYFRNHPSVIFYECGNESISRDHMIEMRDIRDKYDPHGGRAIGSREMLDIREAEYGGEMLYVNKSEHHPMVQTEYCRDEGLRKYWDDWSYPYHKHGDGPLYRNADASAYNQNQDQLAIEMVRRWYDFYRERPGTGRRVNSGGAKIIFSDTQTHCRGAENYRRSGVVDPLRIPKDAYYAHKVMWDGWVDVENHSSYIIGHWNYKPDVVKPVYVVSTGEDVELFVNGKSQGKGKRDYDFLFTFDNVAWEPGVIEAVSYDKNGKELSRTSKKTVGEPAALKLTLMHGPEGVYADGADIAMVQVEVVDANGDRCPLANDMIKFTLDGPAEWRGGIAQGDDNYAFATELPVECGITRVLVRSVPEAGEVALTASAEGLGSETVRFATIPVDVKNGLSKFNPSGALKARLDRGETPLTPSYTDKKVDVKVKSAKAGYDSDNAVRSYDDNELSEWRNDGRKETAWITYELERPAEIDDICVKLTGWRQRSYPIEVYAGDELVWSGDTERSLGYVHLNLKPVLSRFITIRLKGSAEDNDAFGQIVEVVEPKAGELDLFKADGGDKTNHELRIVEIEFLETLRK
ncbi:MAG: glycoside hydrolase family 2 protein [Muribaculaceae bacterium]|nr:glycoside hydrolase family 2 protein [Muribaculaceae bacterium]